MPLDELNEAIDSSRRGATLAARNLSDHAELINVAELIEAFRDESDPEGLSHSRAA